MKTLSKPHAPAKSPKSRRGVALITVLTIISLCTILILTFFQLAQNEMIASDSYNSGLEASQAAEQAVNLVIRQIREATGSSSSGSKASEIGWASQPGAIRTWGSDGKFNKGFKLYSDETMVVSASEKNLAEDDFKELGSWDAKPWQFVDLNEPVIRGDKVYYPIVDPSAREIPEWPTALGKDKNGIEGFDYNLTGVASGAINKAVASVSPADGVKRETLPMPVKWIYQLKDGTLGVLNDSRTFQPVSGGSQPSESNPMVARFAFWADDETCKLNPNVHAGGAAWATPMASGYIDRESFARFQPAQHEWQRYPGHPASTHLAPVIAPGIADVTYNRDTMEAIFALIPRVVGGGSASGTRKVDFRNPAERNGLVADKDRLYASLDEFLLEPGRKGKDAQLREPNDFPDPTQRRGGILDPKVMQDQLERAKFFLSVVSRAPETTVFNTPRVSIWPTRSSEGPGFTPKHHTPFDRLIRFCAEVGRNQSGNERYKYHFERLNADSATVDVEDLERNKDILLYLEKLTDTPIPGLGKGFDTKYTEEERRQILTEIFDYIRSTNLHDDSLYGENWQQAFTKTNVADPITYTNPRRIDANSRTTHKGHGQVTPIRVNWGSFTTKGLGRFTTLYEVGVQVICCADGGDGTRGGPEPGNFASGVEGRSYPGITMYPSGWFHNPERPDKRGGAMPHFSNFPPMPSGIDRSNKMNWPDWLKRLDDPMGPEYSPALVDYAFDPARWNWQLAWLDPTYAGAMPAKKFDRSALSMEAWVSGETRLKADEQLVQSAILFQGFSPSLGWVPFNPDMEIEFELNPLQFDGMPGTSLPDPLAGAGVYKWSSNGIERADHHDRHYGGTRAWSFFLRASSNQNPPSNATAVFNTGLNATDSLAGISLTGRPSPIDRYYADAKTYNRYPFVSRPWKIVGRTVKMTSDVDMKVRIYAAGNDSETEGTAATVPRSLVQTLDIKIPSFSAPSPILAAGDPGYRNEFNAIERGPIAPIQFWSLSWDGVNPNSASRGRLSFGDSHRLSMVSTYDVFKSVGISHGDARMVATMAEVTSDVFQPRINYDKEDARLAHTFRTTPGGSLPGADTAQARRLVPAVNYSPMPLGTGSRNSTEVQPYGDFDNGFGNTMDGPYINKPDEGNTHSLFNRTDANALNLGLFEMARDYGDFPYFVRDWIHEAGTPSYFSPNRIISSPGQFGSLPVGSFRDADGVDRKPWRTLLFRPDVQINKGPVGTNSAGRQVYHPGALDPADHYLLDLFWMPVVEPYAISEPLSTGGKVNLNYQMLPFKHISRSTAIRGVLKSEYLLCIPNRWGQDYKAGMGRGQGYHWRDRPYGGNLQYKSLRAIILEDETLAQFESRFNDGTNPTIFRTASEFCEIHLVPEEQSVRMKQGGAAASISTYTPTLAQMEGGKYWRDHALVGDNSRERAYSNIYPRITTKSNTFKVHYRAQVLRKAKGTTPSQWDPLVDQVVAEYRGSSIVERYVDPNDADLPDYVAAVKAGGGTGINAPTIDQFYKFRVVHPTRFAP